MHQMRGVVSEEYMRNINKMKKVYIKSVTIPKNSKEIKEIANHLNPGSKYVLLPSIFGVYNILRLLHVHAGSVICIEIALSLLDR